MWKSKQFWDGIRWLLGDGLCPSVGKSASQRAHIHFLRAKSIFLVFAVPLIKQLSMSFCSLFLTPHSEAEFLLTPFLFCFPQKPWVVLTSQSLCQGEGVHGGPVVGGMLGLLGCLLVEVVHGAQRVHGVQGVTIHSIVLHGDINLENSGQRREVLRDALLQCPSVSAETWRCRPETSAAVCKARFQPRSSSRVWGRNQNSSCRPNVLKTAVWLPSLEAGIWLCVYTTCWTKKWEGIFQGCYIHIIIKDIILSFLLMYRLTFIPELARVLFLSLHTVSCSILPLLWCQTLFFFFLSEPTHAVYLHPCFLRVFITKPKW